MILEELKPCPFCGGSANVGIKTFDLFNNGAYVYCNKCGARTRLVEADVKTCAVDEAEILWNRRAIGDVDKIEAEEIENGRKWGE